MLLPSDVFQFTVNLEDVVRFMHQNGHVHTQRAQMEKTLRSLTVK